MATNSHLIQVWRMVSCGLFVCSLLSLCVQAGATIRVPASLCTARHRAPFSSGLLAHFTICGLHCCLCPVHLGSIWALPLCLFPGFRGLWLHQQPHHRPVIQHHFAAPDPHQCAHCRHPCLHPVPTTAASATRAHAVRAGRARWALGGKNMRIKTIAPSHQDLLPAAESGDSETVQWLKKSFQKHWCFFKKFFEHYYCPYYYSCYSYCKLNCINVSFFAHSLLLRSIKGKVPHSIEWETKLRKTVQSYTEHEEALKGLMGYCCLRTPGKAFEGMERQNVRF